MGKMFNEKILQFSSNDTGRNFYIPVMSLETMALKTFWKCIQKGT